VNWEFANRRLAEAVSTLEERPARLRPAATPVRLLAP
jgi:hypothetical protein